MERARFNALLMFGNKNSKYQMNGKSYKRKMPKKLMGILSAEECIVAANMLSKRVYVHARLCTCIF